MYIGYGDTRLSPGSKAIRLHWEVDIWGLHNVTVS